MLRIRALVLTAIILVPSAAHLFELPGKIGLDRDAYFTVQGIYSGWALFAIPIFAAIIVNVALFFVLRRDGRQGAGLALLSSALIGLSLVVFFMWILPGNQATANWTTIPGNWEMLRRNWEYALAANAVIIFLAFVAISAVATRRTPERN